jgi:aryl-alcohol dehydrogenase-like predicted oxidoreductase
MDSLVSVSRLALGTVELGMDYGFRGSAHFARPPREQGLALVRHAVSCGIRLIDTAPAYGDAEMLIGESGTGAVIATKITVPAPREAIVASIRTSLERLRRERIDLLQLHNATPELVQDPELLETLRLVQEDGLVTEIGASVDGETAALAVLEQPLFRTLQVAFNLLDQQMASRVFPLAAGRGVRVLVLSAFLRGVLTDRVMDVPAALAPLRDRALHGLAGRPAAALPALAVRFCLSFPEVAAVIAGTRTKEELDRNLAAEQQGPMTKGELDHWRSLAMSGDPLVSPANWSGLT